MGISTKNALVLIACSGQKRTDVKKAYSGPLCGILQKRELLL